MPISNSDFAKKLASYAARHPEPQRMVLANEENEVKDQARQSAEAYWMLGWHESEIASVLEDEGFSEEIVKCALESLVEHAEEILNQGPFALLEAGQLVKLTTGSSGVLKEKRAKVVVLQVGEDLIQVPPEQVDVPATASLTKAFQLRKEASLTISPVLRILGEADPVHEVDVVNQPGTVNKMYLTTPEGKPHRSTPPGYADIIPENAMEVQEAAAFLSKKALDKAQQVRSLIEESKQLGQQEEVLNKKAEEVLKKAKITEQQQQLKDRRLKIKEEADALATEIHNSVASRKDMSEKSEWVVLSRLEDDFLLLEKYIQSIVNEPSAQQLLQYIDGLLEKDPDKYGKLKKQMDSYRQKLTYTEEKVVNFTAVWDIGKERLKKGQSWLDSVIGWWDEFKQSVAGMWEGVQEYVNSWFNDLEPQFDAQSQEIEAFVGAQSQVQEGEQALEATASLLNYARKRR